jgi:succinyl-diaminopimelate desuccinylase
MADALDPVQLTKDLLRLDTVSPPGNEEHCARSLGKLLEDAGFLFRFHIVAAHTARCPSVA